MAAQSNSASQIISETAHAEGGPAKGSTSAQLQSQMGKTKNFGNAAHQSYLKSREARAIDQGQPPSDSISADAQRLATANEQDTASASRPLDPAEQYAADRVQNFENIAEGVASKMANAAEQVTKEEADLTHSREQRASGTTSKGGIASQAQSLASKNERKGT